MRILLAYPRFAEDRIDYENLAVVPMGVYYLGALLRENGHDAEIVNLQAADCSPEAIESLLREHRPDILGLSVMHANRWGAVAMAKAAKKINPGMTTVLGGIGATCLWRHFLTHFPEIDYVVLGEGERTFLSLVQAIEAGGDAGAIDGLALRKDGSPVRTPPAAPIEDLDSLPNPARHFTYQHLSLTRGCPNDCTFCGSPAFWGRRVRSHSAAYFVEQMELLHKRGVNFFYVSDDTFTLRKETVIEVCRGILDRGLKVTWAAISRVDMVNEEILRWMRLAGCIQISYGVESGSEAVRTALNKRTRTDQIERAFALTTRYGMLARAYFIYGCPGESMETIEETIALMRRIKPLMVNFYVLSIYPGTELYEEYKKRFKVDDDIWLSPASDILYCETDPTLPAEAMERFRRTLHHAFHADLPSFALSVELADDEELKESHADFLSRLAMTFDHGDYSKIEDIPDKEGTAEELYRRALALAPDARAFLGLGILLQKRRDYASSAEQLAEGIVHFPDDAQLRLCLAVSLMNLGRFREALDRLQPIADRPEAARFIAACREILGKR